MSDLGDVLAAGPVRPLVVRAVGRVTSVSPLLVAFPGESPAPAVSKNAGYSAVVGDVVMVDVIGGVVRCVDYKVV